MSKKCIEELKKLIENQVLPDVEDYIDELFEEIAKNKNASSKDQETLKEMQEMQDEFSELLEDINNNNLEDDECQEILEEIKVMIKEQEKL